MYSVPILKRGFFFTTEYMISLRKKHTSNLNDVVFSFSIAFQFSVGKNDLLLNKSKV